MDHILMSLPMRRLLPGGAPACAGMVAFAILAAAWRSTVAAEPPAKAAAEASRLAFAADGATFRFDTGLFHGALRAEGKSLGVGPIAAAGSTAALAGRYGLLSHYRLLDAENRYGTAGWDWPSTAKLLPDGAVEVRWPADAAHPFEMQAEYRWRAAGTLDVLTRVTPQRPLRRFELFLASYFAGFPASFAYVQSCPETGGKPGMLEAKKAAGTWQTFARDEDAEKTFADGRWQRPPNPVAWKMMPRLAGALAVRRDAQSGLTALLIASPQDCFAISMPYGEEGHRSVYLSLFGGDLAAGQPAVARARLVLARGLTDQQAIAEYEAYCKSNPSK